LMIFSAMYGTYLVARKRLANMRGWFKRAMIVGIFLPFIANTAGWIMTEIGRQPWTVFGLLTTEDSVSPSVSAVEVGFSLVTFSTLYLILLGILIFLFIRTARKGPYPDGQQDDDAGFDPYESTGGERVVTE